MTRAHFVPTKLNATQMSSFAKALAMDIAANSDDTLKVESIIRGTQKRPVRDQISLLASALYDLAKLYAPMLETMEAAAPNSLFRHDLALTADELYTAAGARR